MPRSFLTPLEIEYVDGRNWKVTQEFDYLVDYENKDTTIRVPAGFVTDFASIPRAFWVVFPPTGKYGKAAVVHDYLYVMGGKIPCGWCVTEGLGPKWANVALNIGAKCPDLQTFTKADADKIFLEAMEVLGVNWLQRKLMYRAVRWFGRGNFGKV